MCAYVLLIVLFVITIIAILHYVIEIYSHVIYKNMKYISFMNNLKSIKTKRLLIPCWDYVVKKAWLFSFYFKENVWSFKNFIVICE